MFKTSIEDESKQVGEQSQSALTPHRILLFAPGAADALLLVLLEVCARVLFKSQPTEPQSVTQAVRVQPFDCKVRKNADVRSVFYLNFAQNGVGGG